MPLIELIEQKQLMNWLGSPPRSPRQINGLFGADSELISLNDKISLALTSDTIAEEIAMGLYRDPYTMGFIAATSSLSDLAAVGARPLGLLLSTCWSSGCTEKFRQTLMAGFCDAAHLAKTFLLGGDTSQGQSTVLNGVGLGVCSNRPVTRIGAEVGHFIVIAGCHGIGPALAYSRLLQMDAEHEVLEKKFRPQINWEHADLLAANASAMIDTSDGVLSAITTLCALNKVGARLYWNEDVIDSTAVEFCRRHSIPLWASWVAEHGDFQLLACVAAHQLKNVEQLTCRVIGEITDASVFELQHIDRTWRINPDWGQLVALSKGLDFTFECRKLLSHFRELGFP